MKKIEIKRMEVITPTNGKAIKSEFIYFQDNGKGWFVQNLDEQQNANLFCDGIKLIFEMDGKRGLFLQRFVTMMARTFEINECFARVNYSQFIAFVCDVALHNQPKLAHPLCYDKVFKKYVANLCYNYYLDEDFELFKLDETLATYQRYIA